MDRKDFASKEVNLLIFFYKKLCFKLKVAYFHGFKKLKNYILFYCLKTPKGLQPGEAPFVRWHDNEEICKAQNISQRFRLIPDFLDLSKG